jgi:hypothetical protein
MPFGLTNVPAVFQALVNVVLRNMLNRFVFVYLDDILVFSRSAQEHMLHVRQVLQHLLENHLFVKEEKCEFHHSTIPFLGFIIAAGSVQMDPGKVRVVVDSPPAYVQSATRTFLGDSLTFIAALSGVTASWLPLSAHTSPKVLFTWSLLGTSWTQTSSLIS